jgi:hypothetical protein
MRTLPQPEIGYIRPQSGRFQQPDADSGYNDNIQNRFDAGGHRNIPVDQVQATPISIPTRFNTGIFCSLDPDRSNSPPNERQSSGLGPDGVNYRL